MSKIEKILKYIDSVPNYSAILENKKLRITYQYTYYEENMRMNLLLSHNSLWYAGDIVIYDSSKHRPVFEYQFTCSEEEDVIKVLSTLRCFGMYIYENTRKLNLEIDSSARQGYYRT